MYTIVEDNRDFLLINKDPGVSFHRDGGTTGLTGALKSEQGIPVLYTVHRLDKMTSGLLLFAKNKRTALDLSRQFRERHVEKYYLALSDRRPKKKQGLIKGDMVRSRRGAWRLSRTLDNPAITRFFSYSSGDGLRLFILKPYTGKTHQIRVAMKSLGAPILGDLLYHKKETPAEEHARGYLHSYAIRFKLKDISYEFIRRPDAGRYFMSALFYSALTKCEKPWDLRWPSV